MEIGNTQSAPRPSVPPKPKPITKPDPLVTHSTTVGTQVNLLRKFSSGTRQESPATSRLSPNVNELEKNRISSPAERTSSIGSSVKPALPPKPSPNCFSPPRRSSTTTTTPPSKPTRAPADLNSKKSSTAPHASIEELDNLSDLNSPPTPLKESQNSVLSGRSSISVAKGTSSHQLFQYPTPVFPFSPAQRLEAQRKSASLGRNINSFLPTPINKSTTLSRVIPLDLSPSNPSSRLSGNNINSTSRLSGALRSSLNFTPPRGAFDPPPPPPRSKRKPISPLSLEPTSPSASVLSGSNSAPVKTSLPIYAVVDKEKKWDQRRQKQLHENNNGVESAQELSTASATVPDVTSNNNEKESLRDHSQMETSTPKSWLGKYIEKVEGDEDRDKSENSSSFLHATVSVPVVTATEEIPVPTSQHANRLSVNESFLFNHVVVLTQEEEEAQPNVANLPQVEELPETLIEPKEIETDHPELALLEATSVVTTEVIQNEDLKVKEAVNSPATEDNTEDVFGASDVIHIQPVRGDNSLDDEARMVARKLSEFGGEDRFETLLDNELEEVVNTTLVHGNDVPSALVLGGVTTSCSTTDEPEDAIKSPSDADIVYQIVRSQKQFKSPNGNRPEATEDQIVIKTEPQDEKTLRSAEIPADTPALLVNDPAAIPDRRRSWNGLETGSSLSDSSRNSSSSSSLRDRTSSISGGLPSGAAWLDEGDISTGALGDAENSDAAPCSSEALSESRPPGHGEGDSFMRRTKLGILGSKFGSGDCSSSSASSLPHVAPPLRKKEKSNSRFYVGGAGAKSPPGKTKKVRSEIIMTNRALSKEARAEGGKALSLPQAPSSEVHTAPASQDLNSISSVSTLEEGSSAESVTKVECYNDILEDLSESERKPFLVAREIMTSERVFVNNLNLLTVEFPGALKAAWEAAPTGHPIIQKADLDIILGGLPILKGVNQVLLTDMEYRIANWKTNPKLADIFVNTGAFLKHYSTYIRDFPKILQHYELCRHKNLKFSRAVSEFEKSPRCKGLDIRAYMLTPVQRMPKYQLLLGNYLKSMTPDSLDYEDTIKALSIVTKAAEHANEAIRHQENAEKLVHLQSRLTHHVILKADRHLILEGELLKVCRKELQPRYFVLMSDCLLCLNYAGTGGAAGTKEFKLRYELPLAGMRVVLAGSEDYQNEFSVISITRSFNLVAKSPKEREEWMKSLDVAIRTNIKKRAACSTPEMEKEFQIGKVAPVWIADSRVTMCQACTAEFKITFRRHHCRACGKVVCGNCSGSEAPLQYQNFEANRVCTDCYEYLQEEFDRENHQNSQEEVELIRSRFKKGTPNISKKAAKHKKSIPPRLEVHANSSGSAMSGYLHWKEPRKSWKKQWFVLIDQVLYVCAASEDVAALKSIPILGYQVEAVSVEAVEGEDGRTIFQLTHSGQEPYVFQAENSSSAEKWMTAMREATVLK